MRDDYLSKSWADSQHHFSRDVRIMIAKFLKLLSVSLDRVNRYQFDAPWRRRKPRLSR